MQYYLVRKTNAGHNNNSSNLPIDSRIIMLDNIISMVLLRISTAVQPMTGIEGFKYYACDG